jgi:uncharacterized protein (TIGR03790 family)
VLVVYNSSAADSLSVARYYMAQRHIPESNRCRIAVDSVDYIKQGEFETRVKAPIRKCLETVGKQTILYIVFSYQTPYVVTVGDRGFALDSFVADIWDEYSTGRPGNEVGSHPYFGEAQSQGNAYIPFVALAAYRDLLRAKTIYSVWRLDAANPGLAKGLVDKAMFAEANGLSGRGCFDLQYGGVESLADYGSAAGDWDIHQSAELARRAGFEVVEDDTRAEFGTPPAPLRCDGAAFYAGWYSLGHYNDAFTWNPGAIGLHLDSASATNPRGGGNWSATAVMKGITITSGAAAEPYLEGLAHPDQVFLYLFQGANAGDALLRSTRWLKWMILNIGDPLYRPFPKGVAPFNSPTQMDTMLALAPQSLPGGNTATGTIALVAPATEGGTVVTLKSEQPEIASVPKTVTVPAKAAYARFPVITQPPKDMTAVRISMTAGAIHRSNTLVVYPCMPPLTLSTAKVSGGTPVVGTVMLYQPAPSVGAIVKLSSDHPALVTLPPEVGVSAGENRAAFQIDTHAVTVETPVVITVSTGGCSRTASLTVAQ